jgi:regulator of cell morphogenesis and NO signaling
MESMMTRTVKHLVTDDHRRAAIFEKYAIDFCCNGGRTLADACTEHGADPAAVAQELQQLTVTPVISTFRPDEWGLDVLADFIVDTHHRYVRSMIPVLLPHVDKILSVHGKNHPELSGIAEHVHAVAAELTSHMRKEEIVLFPAIRALVHAGSGTAGTLPKPFGSIRNPIAVMESEHIAAGDALSAIRGASQGYTLPPDACTTYGVTYRELEEFERDLHQHVHLENNILFPRAIALEDQQSGRGAYS